MRLWAFALTMSVGVTIGVAIGLYFQHPTYNGPQVASFTTGGLRCSPFCGHLDELRALQPHQPGAPEPRPPEARR